MAIGCGATFAKIILIIYNIIFLLTGLALIALGIWLIADGSVTNFISLSFNGSNSTFFRNAAILLIAMGALVLVISVIGFVGAILENTILLGIYIAFLIVIFCGEIAGGVVAIVYKDRIVYNLDSILLTSLSGLVQYNSSKSYYNYNSPYCQSSDTGYLWDYAQITLKCCGVNGPDDYTNAFNGSSYNFKSMCSNLTNSNYPVSCFPFKSTNTSFGNFHTNPDDEYQAQALVDFSSGPYSTGCVNQVAYYIQRYAPVLIGIGIGFGILELYGILFAVCLCRNVSTDDDRCNCCFSCCESDGCCESCEDGCGGGLCGCCCCPD